MSTTLEKIAAGDVSRILAEPGIAKDKPVTVLVDEKRKPFRLTPRQVLGH